MNTFNTYSNANANTHTRGHKGQCIRMRIRIHCQVFMNGFVNTSIVIIMDQCTNYMYTGYQSYFIVYK